MNHLAYAIALSVALAAPLLLETATATSPVQTAMAAADDCQPVHVTTSPPDAWVDPDCVGATGP